MNHSTEHLPHAFGVPEVRGVIRATPEDFFVDEILPFEPEGEGEHVLLHIEKRNTNTDWLAGQLARFAGIPKRDVSYAGLKDRNAVTRQWFSLGLAGKPEPDWQQLQLDSVRVLQHARHRRKLRRGALQGNRFRIVVRELQGELDTLPQRLERIRRQGVPNYFGEQRFGRDGNNLQRAVEMFRGRRIKDRNTRGLYLSAARSWLFNELLSERVQAGDWNRAIPGDAMLLAGSNSYFVAEAIDAEIERRLADFDIHPSGPLWGRGTLATTSQALELEGCLSVAHPVLCRGLEKAGLEQARRALRLVVPDLESELDTAAATLILDFSLPPGSYATTVLRELIAPAAD
ncbi:MAG: tRNA pseudouridine(13) synthase TruD [Alphaproteobacteria bacterium]